MQNKARKSVFFSQLCYTLKPQTVFSQKTRFSKLQKMVCPINDNQNSFENTKGRYLSFVKTLLERWHSMAKPFFEACSEHRNLLFSVLSKIENLRNLRSELKRFKCSHLFVCEPPFTFKTESKVKRTTLKT